MSILGEIGYSLRQLKGRVSALRLQDLSNVSRPEYNESILKYDTSDQTWKPIVLAGTGSGTEFLDGLVDGGFASTIHLEILDLDGGHA